MIFLLLNMFTGSLDYTICSTDPKHYNRIYCNLTAPITKYAKMIVTCLTANCDIVVLTENDYITITEILSGESRKTTTYYANAKYKSLDTGSFTTLLKENILKLIEHVYLDESERLVIGHNHEFIIEDMSYNFKLLSGFYNVDLPIKSQYDSTLSYYAVFAESVGLSLLTPVLYLTSNIGMQSYRTNGSRAGGRTEKDSEVCGAKIVMRLNNAFCSNAPIIVNNADFETTILSNDLSCLEFTLVDANMHEISLLSPLYLSIHVDAIPDIEIPSMFELVNGMGNAQKNQ